MILAVSHDILAKRLGIFYRMTIVTHHFEVGFSIAVENITNHEIIE
jgi:hypothetical protein